MTETDAWREAEIEFVEKMLSYADTYDSIAERAKERAKFELNQAKRLGYEMERL